MLISILLVVVGLALVLLVVIDFGNTAFVPTGEGPITSFITRTTFNLMYWVSGKNGYNRFLQYTGLVTIFTLSLSWVLTLWIGFSCIYIADPNSVLVGQDKSLADTFEKIYHVGYTLSTLGIGDYVPGNNLWRVITSLVSFVGLVTITMSITYLVPVISSAIQKRSLSLQISSLGESPEEIVINSFNGENFQEAGSALTSLSSDIFKYAQNHLAYPILHYMHSSNPSENITLRLITLDEALTILQFHVPNELRPNHLQLQSVRRAITTYLQTVKHIDGSEEPPPLPHFHLIEEFTGVRLINTASPESDDIYQALGKRRRLLYGTLLNDGWQWEDIRTEKFISELDVQYTNKLMQT